MEPVMLVIIIILLGIIVITGYVYNMLALARMQVVTGMSLLRMLGVIFVPMGCVLGFINDKK